MSPELTFASGISVVREVLHLEISETLSPLVLSWVQELPLLPETAEIARHCVMCNSSSDKCLL